MITIKKSGTRLSLCVQLSEFDMHMLRTTATANATQRDVHPSSQSAYDNGYTFSILHSQRIKHHCYAIATRYHTSLVRIHC